MNNHQSQPWLKHYDKHVQKFKNLPLSITGLFNEAISKYGDRTFLVFHDREYSYSKIGDLVDSVAANLINLGLKKGNKVALILPNIPQFIIAYYGILKAGGIVVAMNPNYTKAEFEHLFYDAEPQRVICLKKHLTVIGSLTKTASIQSFFISQADISKDFTDFHGFSNSENESTQIDLMLVGMFAQGKGIDVTLDYGTLPIKFG